MAYTNVQNSGLLETTTGAGLSWSPGSAPTLNNLLTARIWRGGSVRLATTDIKDSSGTPKVFNADAGPVGSTTVNDCCIYSLVVPSGFTTPIKDVGTQLSLQGIFDEWSGNATTSVLDQANTKEVTTTNTSSGTGPSITTGASAGLVLSVICLDGVGASSAIADTGTSFTADATEQDNSAHDSGMASRRTASVASATLNDAWTWTAGVGVNDFSAAVASYKLAPTGNSGSGGTVEVVPVLAGSGKETFTETTQTTVESVPTFAGSGAQTFSASGAFTESVVVFSGSGAQTITGSGAFVQSVPAPSGSGKETFADTGANAFIEAVPVFSGSGSMSVGGETGSGSFTESVPVLSASGAQTFTGSGAVAEAVVVFAGTGNIIGPPVTGSGAFTVSVPVFAAVGTIAGAGVAEPTGGGDRRRYLRELLADPAIAVALADGDEEFATLLQLTRQPRSG